MVNELSLMIHDKYCTNDPIFIDFDLTSVISVVSAVLSVKIRFYYFYWYCNNTELFPMQVEALQIALKKMCDSQNKMRFYALFSNFLFKFAAVIYYSK